MTTPSELKKLITDVLYHIWEGAEMIKDYWLATNDDTGKTMVIVPTTRAKDAFEAMKIANKYFKIKVENLHCIAGTKKGDKVKGRDSLSKSTNCWMVWR